MGKAFSAVVTGAEVPEAEDYEAHFLHCVDYMRQAAMCAGDLTIEPRGENGRPGHADLVNAFNGLHGESLLPRQEIALGRCSNHFAMIVCKDYREVRDYLQGKEH